MKIFSISAAIVIILGVILYSSWSGYGHDADRNSGESTEEMFQRALNQQSAGKHIYWLGPAALGYRFALVAYSGQPYGVEIMYRGSPVPIHVVTYPGRRRPDGDILSYGRVVRRVQSSSGQLVLLAIDPTDPTPSAAALDAVAKALRPATLADVDSLAS